MSDGTQEAAGAPQDNTPAASEPVNLQENTEQVETTDPEVVDDSEEIEHEGAKYRVPKTLKSAFMMQADYTRKTQEVADQRKGLETERESFTQATRAHQAYLQDVGRVMTLNERIAELEKVDWQTLEANDPFAAQAKFREYTLAKGQRDGLIQQIQVNEQKRSQDAQQDFAKRYAETNQTLADPVKGIKGWNQELADKLATFAKGNGLTDEDIRYSAVKPSMVKLLHMAFLGDQLVKEKTAAAKAANQETTPVPLVKVSGGGAKSQSINPQTGPEKMDDFAKWLMKKTA